MSPVHDWSFARTFDDVTQPRHPTLDASSKVLEPAPSVLSQEQFWVLPSSRKNKNSSMAFSLCRETRFHRVTLVSTFTIVFTTRPIVLVEPQVNLMTAMKILVAFVRYQQHILSFIIDMDWIAQINPLEI